MQNYKVWIESEEWAEGELDIFNDNTDVFVEFADGSSWEASFFTYSNIEKLTEKNRQTGECLSGKYLWSANMILVDDVSRERIEEVIKHLIHEGEFKSIFSKQREIHK